jgi:ParB/RepB/Spo0J family partition protein
MTTDLKEILVALLHAHPDQPRHALGAETLASVQDAIAQAGGAYPQSLAVTVRRRDEGGFEILAGHHRVEAARLSKTATVWAFVRAMDDAKAGMFLASSNSHSEMTQLEHARHALMLKARYGLGLYEYARRIGRSKGWISDVVSAYRVVVHHGGLDGPYAKLPASALEPAVVIKDIDMQRRVLDLLLVTRGPSVIAGRLCAAVQQGEEPEAALRRIEGTREGPIKQQPEPGESEGSRQTRPDLSARGALGDQLASMVEALAHLLDVREEVERRLQPDMTDPEQAAIFFARVETRLNRERQTIYDIDQARRAAGQYITIDPFQAPRHEGAA